MRKEITCWNSNASTKTQHWLDFLIASRLQWMASAAVCVNSCLTEKIGQSRLRESGKNNSGRIIWTMRYFVISQLWKMQAGLGIVFIENSQLFQDIFPRELAMTYFLCCLEKAEAARCIGVQNKLKLSLFLLLRALFTWNLWAHKLQFTTVKELGGLRDSMEQSVWISCRIFVRLELSTVVLLTPSVCLSPRPCGWLPYIYKSPGTHAYVLKQARWVSLARLITFTSPQPVCSSNW